ncbi:hypothetical protein C1645_878275 [Glomus cerebriforme]|uniref:Uncharacterized protein n=1 Tax=Glomus cerebriforme TaxID=658196 RepID=A0A397SWE8_9GLOM|nr:hypothetical protein C1645_878275 [Glomus cerebriforme]
MVEEKLNDTIPLYLKSSDSFNSEQKSTSNLYKNLAIYGFLIVLTFVSFILIFNLLFTNDDTESVSFDDSFDQFPSYSLNFKIDGGNVDESDIEEFDWTEITK